MSWARPEVLNVYLSGQQVVLRSGTDPLQRFPVVEDRWADALEQLLVTRPRRRWRLWLGGRLCQLHSLEPVEGLRHIEEAEAAAAAVLSRGGVAVETRLAMWPPRIGRPWVCLSLPAGLSRQCQARVEAQSGHLLEMRPWWTSPRQCQAHNAAMFDDEVLTHWHTDERGALRAGSVCLHGAPQGIRPEILLRRWRVHGPVPAWRLAWDAPQPASGGWGVLPWDEAEHAAA